MKLSQLRQIIREEIKSVMDEESNPINEFQIEYIWQDNQCWRVDDEGNWTKAPRHKCGK